MMSLEDGKGSKRYAWVLLFAVSAFWTVRAVAGLFGSASNPGIGSSYDSFLVERSGKTFAELAATDPALASLVNLLGAEGSIFMLAFGVFGMAISRVSFRRGERWSWYVLWWMPVSLVGLVVLRISVAGTAVDFLVLLVGILLAVTLFGLVLPYRRFFPKNAVPTLR